METKLTVIFWVCLIVGFIIYGVVGCDCHYSNPHWEQITVTDKNINPSKSSEKWLVYTKGEVYCITDLTFIGFFESSDVYNQIEVGKTYDVYVSGKRLPFLSYYKCIRSVKEVKHEKENSVQH